MKYFSTTLATVLTFAAATAMAALPDPSKLPPASTRQGLTFAKDIHPIFDETCVHCHGEQRPRGGLRLDTLDGVMKGSKDHVVVVSGHSDQSRLVFAVSEINGKISMPPKPRAHRPNAVAGTNAPAAPAVAPAHPWKPLTPEQVGVIRAWIDQGARP
ncbi:MAG TPA: c-type cytochrome domain-containing protein [Candidatus Polarisedimenticolia bacterium]|nr:c-type cytochrome domain-containing protein [Candidatus Polarisedimenticolia bacterium]